MSGIGELAPRLRVGGTASNGFTLIEAMVAIAIAGLIGGLLFPRVQAGIAALEFRGALAGVIIGLAQARAEAIRGGRPARFAWGEDGRAWRAAGRAIRLPTSTRIGPAGEGQLLFWPDGNATGRRIVVTGAGRRAWLVIRPETGLVRVVRG